MHTMLMIYNNCGLLSVSMNQKQFWDSDPQNGAPNSPSFFPRVIREFDDGHEEPLLYGGN